MLVRVVDQQLRGARMSEAKEPTGALLDEAIIKEQGRRIVALEAEIDKCGDRIRSLESENSKLRDADRKSELFVKEMLIRCADALRLPGKIRERVSGFRA